MATKSLLTHRDYVAGGWTEAVDGGVREILNPATSETIAVVPEGTQADVDRAVAAAREAGPGWARLTPRQRSERLFELAARATDEVSQLAQTESRNVGKPLASARSEIEMSIDHLRFFAGAARTLNGQLSDEYEPGYLSMVRREPIGVIGQIAPWNYPLMMAVWKMAPALATGNTVVLKPSEHTPLTALLLASLAEGILPPGVLNVVTGDGKSVGAGIVRHPQVGMVSLTGGLATGRAIAAAAAETLKPLHLELGGKAPVVVFDDADVADVVRGLREAGYGNSGQDCTAACRVIAGPRVHDELLVSLVPAVQALRLGDPGADDVDLGPVITAAHQNRVLGFVNRAVDAGADVLTGGVPGHDSGFFVEPTVIANVSQHDEIVQNEVFGPVVTVQKAAGDAELISLANDVGYGLGASVWTRDLDRALEASRALSFGTVWVNDHNVVTAEMPFGGLRGSGYGRDLSVAALEAYTDQKHVMIKHQEPRW